jgi:uncharacterized membrane protein YphA (DoxX/SURF4 family)
MKKILFIFIITMTFLTPLSGSAHVKWFTTVSPEKVTIEDILSPMFLITTVLIAAFLAILTQIIPKLMEFKVARLFDAKLDELRKYSRLILKYGTAVALTLQVISGTIFAPEFTIDSTVTAILVWVTIGLLLIPHNYATKAAAIIMLGLFIKVGVHIGWFHMLDYGFYLALIGLFLIDKTKTREWGFPLLYLGTGLSLCWVAVEKWVYPGMSIDIIVNHGVPTFGFPPEMFIVLSAFIEFVVGYLLVVGILNRLLAVVLTAIFIMTTTLFGGVEIVGHFIVHIILLTFIIEGVSFYLPPIKIHKTRVDQMVFVFLNFIFVLATFLLIYYRFG